MFFFNLCLRHGSRLDEAHRHVSLSSEREKKVVPPRKTSLKVYKIPYRRTNHLSNRNTLRKSPVEDLPKKKRFVCRRDRRR